MTPCPGCGWDHPPGRLDDVVWQVDADPDFARGLPDHVVATLAEWADGTSAALRAEARRRHDRYATLAARFAAAARTAP
jgi:hypothetical protein